MSFFPERLVTIHGTAYVITSIGFVPIHRRVATKEDMKRLTKWSTVNE